MRVIESREELEMEMESRLFFQPQVTDSRLAAVAVWLTDSWLPDLSPESMATQASAWEMS